MFLLPLMKLFIIIYKCFFFKLFLGQLTVTWSFDWDPPVWIKSYRLLFYFLYCLCFNCYFLCWPWNKLLMTTFARSLINDWKKKTFFGKLSTTFRECSWNEKVTFHNVTLLLSCRKALDVDSKFRSGTDSELSVVQSQSNVADCLPFDTWLCRLSNVVFTK